MWVLSCVLHFSIIFSAAEIPRGQNREHHHWAEDPVFSSQPGSWTPQVLVPSFQKFTTQLGTRAMSKEGDTVQEGGGMCPPLLLHKSVHQTRSFAPQPGSCPSSLDIYHFPRGDFCTDESKWVTWQGERLHVPWAPVCMILCKLMENS